MVSSRILLLLFLAVCAQTGPTLEKNKITVGEIERTFYLYRPAIVLENQPLVVLLHGAGSDGFSFARQTMFHALADRYGFLLIYPDAYRQGDTRIATWNAGKCCGTSQSRNINDIAFIKTIFAYAIEKHGVDPGKIFLAGYSNGGMLTYRMACSERYSLRAIAIVAGSRMVDCTPQQNLPLLVIHGTHDRNVPYGGGRGPASSFEDSKLSVEQSIAPFSTFDDCRVAVFEQEFILQHELCRLRKSRSRVEVYTILQGGHEWPAHGQPGRPGMLSPASELIGNFFYEVTLE